ncbi:hypothetical protein [Phyllobacterium leguminum]|nr:hypothetical protein [Phyllobacterium leguminum]
MLDLIHGLLSVVSIGLTIATVAVWIGVLLRSDRPSSFDNDFQ